MPVRLSIHDTCAHIQTPQSLMCHDTWKMETNAALPETQQIFGEGVWSMLSWRPHPSFNHELLSQGGGNARLSDAIRDQSKLAVIPSILPTDTSRAPKCPLSNLNVLSLRSAGIHVHTSEMWVDKVQNGDQRSVCAASGVLLHRGP
jgi:hypothetical protein